MINLNYINIASDLNKELKNNVNSFQLNGEKFNFSPSEFKKVKEIIPLLREKELTFEIKKDYDLVTEYKYDKNEDAKFHITDKRNVLNIKNCTYQANIKINIIEKNEDIKDKNKIENPTKEIIDLLKHLKTYQEKGNNFLNRYYYNDNYCLMATNGKSIISLRNILIEGIFPNSNFELRTNQWTNEQYLYLNEYEKFIENMNGIIKKTKEEKNKGIWKLPIDQILRFLKSIDSIHVNFIFSPENKVNIFEIPLEIDENNLKIENMNGIELEIEDCQANHQFLTIQRKYLINYLSTIKKLFKQDFFYLQLKDDCIYITEQIDDLPEIEIIGMTCSPSKEFKKIIADIEHGINSFEKKDIEHDIEIDIVNKESIQIIKNEEKEIKNRIENIQKYYGNKALNYFLNIDRNIDQYINQLDQLQHYNELINKSLKSLYDIVQNLLIEGNSINEKKDFHHYYYLENYEFYLNSDNRIKDILKIYDENYSLIMAINPLMQMIFYNKLPLYDNIFNILFNIMSDLWELFRIEYTIKYITYHLNEPIPIIKEKESIPDIDFIIEKLQEMKEKLNSCTIEETEIIKNKIDKISEILCEETSNDDLPTEKENNESESMPIENSALTECFTSIFQSIYLDLKKEIPDIKQIEYQPEISDEIKINNIVKEILISDIDSLIKDISSNPGINADKILKIKNILEGKYE